MKQWKLAPYTQAHLALVTSLLETIRKDFPAPPTIKPDEKRTCLGVGLLQLAQLNQIAGICQKNPEVMPRFHEVEDFYAAQTSIEVLSEIKFELQKEIDKVETALLCAKHVGYQMALDYYYSLKRASKLAMPHLHDTYMKVRETFLSKNDPP